MTAARRRLLAVTAIALVATVFAWPKEPSVDEASAPGRDSSIAVAARRDIVTRGPSGHRPAMPPLGDRIAAVVGASGIPDEARGLLSALGRELRALREREATAVGDRERLVQIADERRTVSAKARELLEALPPKYRATMRRHRVSARQLAEWAADHPQDVP